MSDSSQSLRGVRFSVSATQRLAALDPVARGRLLHVLEEIAAVVAIDPNSRQVGAMTAMPLVVQVPGVHARYVVDQEKREVVVQEVAGGAVRKMAG